MFFSREKELEMITSLLDESGKSILLYGKRRVGKIELIMKLFNDRPFINYECVVDTLEINISNFRIIICSLIKSTQNMNEYLRFNCGSTAINTCFLFKNCSE